jgi:hypothetical protein
MIIGMVFMNKKIFFSSVLMVIVLLLVISYAIGCNSHRGQRTNRSTEKDTATAYISAVEFNPIINVYIENSGSMDGYVKGQTEFEHIVYNYLVDLKQIGIAKELNLNYINSEILPQQDDIKDFIEKLEPSSFKAKGGVRGTSDISKMIEEILAEMNDSIVSIFISDCIFSPGKGKDAAEYLNNQGIGIKNDIGNYFNNHPQFAVVGYRCVSQFEGYCYDKNDSGKYYKGSRPFYIWLFGGQGALNRIRIEMQKNNRILNGVENVFTVFAGGMMMPDSCYAIKIKSGNFDLDKKDSKHTLKNLKADRGGKIRFSVEVNYAPLILSEEYLCDTALYELSDPKFKLVSVERIKAYKKYSHVLTFETEHVHPSTLDIMLKTAIPLWPEQYNDDEGNEISEDNADKTFGIKYMTDGISDAIIRKDYYTRMTIYINK